MRISRNARHSVAWGFVPAIAAFAAALWLTDISVWALLLFTWVLASVLTLAVAFARVALDSRRAARQPDPPEATETDEDVPQPAGYDPVDGPVEKAASAPHR